MIWMLTDRGGPSLMWARFSTVQTREEGRLTVARLSTVQIREEGRLAVTRRSTVQTREEGRLTVASWLRSCSAP